MQFKIPQNVQREDKIVGPLTLKQLIICGIGFAVAYAIYTSLAKLYIWITWFPPVAVVALVTVAFAFIRPLDLSFGRWILLWIEFSIMPRRRFWIQSSGEAFAPVITGPKTKGKAELKAEAKAEEMVDKRKKLEELSKILNTHSK